MGAFRLAGADQGMKLVDEEGRSRPPPPRSRSARIFRRSSNSPRNLAPATSAPRSSAIRVLVLQALGHVAIGDPERPRPSTIAVLPTPGSPISTGFVLGAPGQDLDGAGGSPHRGR